MQRDEMWWSQLEGALREPYDPRPAIAAIANGDIERGYEELWENLYHQGDVGSSSYAALPGIADLLAADQSGNWNPYALAASIEETRMLGDSSPLPSDLDEDYRLAWRKIVDAAVRQFPLIEALLARSVLAVLALDKGQLPIAVFALLDASEQQEALELLEGA